MASTSTNKQPLMVDRPFFRGAKINSGSTVIADASNPDFGDLIQLVRVGDLPSEDGALVEDIFVVSAEGYPNDGGVRTAAFGVYVYAPNQAAPSTSTSLLVGKFEVGLSGSTEGVIQRVELPALSPLLRRQATPTSSTRLSAANLKRCILRKDTFFVSVTSVTDPLLCRAVSAPPVCQSWLKAVSIDPWLGVRARMTLAGTPTSQRNLSLAFRLLLELAHSISFRRRYRSRINSDLISI
jgi:hypothetical protein